MPFVEWLESLGVWAPVVAPFFTVAAALLPIPGEVPAAANGMIYELWLAILVTWGGSLAGAWLSYELARRFGRPWVEIRVPSGALRSLDDLVVRGRSAVLVARLVPFVSFHVLNYGLGLTAMRRGTFLWTTGLGIAPGAVAFTAGGAGLMALFQHSPLLALPVTGGLFLLVAWIAWRKARRPVVEGE